MQKKMSAGTRIQTEKEKTELLSINRKICLRVSGQMQILGITLEIARKRSRMAKETGVKVEEIEWSLAAGEYMRSPEYAAYTRGVKDRGCFDCTNETSCGYLETEIRKYIDTLPEKQRQRLKNLDLDITKHL